MFLTNFSKPIAINILTIKLSQISRAKLSTLNNLTSLTKHQKLKSIIIIKIA
jgi:hypothetical protein